MKPPSLPTGHRHLLAHLIAGGLIQQDDSGLAWVCASRSGGHFTNETVARVRERGFSHARQRYKLVESDHRGKLMATLDPKPPRPPREPPKARKRRKAREAAQKHAPKRPRKAKRQVESFT